MSKTVEVERHSRRDFLKWGVGVVAAVAAAGVGGKIYGENEVRGQLLPPGELSPGLEKKLIDANHLVVDIQGWTAASLREAKWEDVPDFPFPIPDGEHDPENTPSEHRWIAIAPGGVYLPREEDDTVEDLASDVRTANTAAGRVDSNLRFVSGSLSDFLEAEIVSLRLGQSIFQAGHVVTSRQIVIDGVAYGIAIGRTTPTEPISFIAFDVVSRDAPLPAGVSAGGFVVAK